MKIGQRELLRYIMSKECPCCEGPKLDGCCFCDACYVKLPEDLKGKIRNGLRSLSEGIRNGISFLEKRY
jgi:hypothetical protein